MTSRTAPLRTTPLLNASMTAALEQYASWQEPLFEDLHRHPELSMREERTRAIVAEQLSAFGYAVQEIGGGVVGVWENGEGPTVLMRADMDGLPVAKASGLPYASTHTQQDADGRTQPTMHACGHDVHVVAGLGAARLLAEHLGDWSGTYIALFQPGEEIAAGARAMVEDGLVDKVPAPDACLGQHVLTAPVGREGRDRSGTGEEILEQLVQGVQRIVRAECEAARSPQEPEFELFNHFPVTDNDAEVTEVLRAAFLAQLGEERVEHMAPVTASEDFSILPDAFGVPYCYWGFGGYVEGRETAPNHSPLWAPDRQPTLRTGTEAAASAALALLDGKG